MRWVRVRPSILLGLWLLLAGCGSDNRHHQQVSIKPTPEELGRQLHRVSPGARLDAARGLAAMGPEAGRAVYAMVRAIRDPSEEVRATLVPALAAAGRGELHAIRALVLLQGDDAERLARAARDALDRLGPPSELATRVVTPAEYEEVTEQVCVEPEQKKTIQVPAVFETVNGASVMVKRASAREEAIPAVYKTVTRRVVVVPAVERWELSEAALKELGLEYPSSVDPTESGVDGGGLFDW